MDPACASGRDSEMGRLRATGNPLLAETNLETDGSLDGRGFSLCAGLGAAGALPRPRRNVRAAAEISWRIQGARLPENNCRLRPDQHERVQETKPAHARSIRGNGGTETKNPPVPAEERGSQ